jgi:tRNA dimethylallyltransferase
LGFLKKQPDENFSFFILRSEMIQDLPLLIITGPTSSGKTIFALRCAHFLKNNCGTDAEIINADASQLYDELKILTSYPSQKILGLAQHSLYGILSPLENSSAAFWLKLALENIQRLRRENKTAILCGGTGLYISALLNGISHIPSIPSDFRRRIREKFHEIGREAFFCELTNLDPFSDQTLHCNDTQRILRAYEVVAFTGKPISKWWEKRSATDLPISTVVLAPARKELNARCLDRINHMIKNGLLPEMEDFSKRYPGYEGALRKVIGYEEALQLLKKETTESDSLNNIYWKTRRYAKRQSTWFRHQFPSAYVAPNFGDAVDPEETLIRAMNAATIDRNF